MTLNQIVKVLNEIADGHKQINHFYFGDSWEWLANGEVTYPAMFVVLGGANVGIQSRIKSYSFDIYFLDKGKGDERNETEVLSDMMEVATDVLAQLRHPSFEWEVDTDVAIDFFTEFQEDSLAGVKGSFTLSIPFGVDRCSVPSDFEYPDGVTITNTTGSYFESHGDIVSAEVVTATDIETHPTDVVKVKLRSGETVFMQRIIKNS